MIYLKTEQMPEQTNTSELGIIITVVSGVLVGWWKYVSDSFRDKREAREAEIIRQEKERSETITKAVQTGLESFNKEIRQEFRDHKHTTDKQFDNVNKRIDDLFKELREK
jgi:hypothetical protein